MENIKDFLKTTWNTAKNPIVAAKIMGQREMSDEEHDKMQEIIQPVANAFGYNSQSDGRGIVGVAILFLVILIILTIVILAWAGYILYGISTSTSTDKNLRKKAGMALVFALIIGPLTGPLYPFIFIGFLIYAHKILNKMKVSVDLDIPATNPNIPVAEAIVSGNEVPTATQIDVPVFSEKFGSSSSSYEL